MTTAFFHARISEDEQHLYVRLPPDIAPAGTLGKLKGALPGTRKASQAFQDRVAEVLQQGKFTRMACNSACYHSPSLDVTLCLHGDDFIAEGESSSLDSLDGIVQGSFEVKVSPRVGPDASNEGSFLKRTIRWSRRGFSYEADEQHARTIVGELSLLAAKPSPTLCVKETRKGV